MSSLRHRRVELILLGAGVLGLAFLVTLLLAYFPDILSNMEGDSPIKWSILLSVFLLGLAFVVYLGNTVFAVWRSFTQYAQHFYDLSEHDAGQLVEHLLNGPRRELPLRPILRVQEGQVDADGPTTLLKVGGPGYLSVAHDSVVVTSQSSRLHRVLGPGFHELASVERVWDVIDLRPQRRSLRVEFMTLDGIPAYCDAEIRFRVAGPSLDERLYSREDSRLAQPYTFDAEAILKLATSKYIKSREGSGRIQDWRIGLVNGALDGFMRDELERYPLDAFFNPRYWAMQQGTAVEPAVPPPVKPDALEAVQAVVEGKIIATARERGIVVESLHLAPVMPDEDAIPRQWLEFWQAKLQRGIDSYTLDEEMKRTQLTAQANVNAQVEIVNSMLERIQELTQEGMQVPSALIAISFMDVLRTMSDRDPAVQQLMFQQAESLIHVVNAIQKKKTPFGPATPAPKRLVRTKV